MATLPHNCDPDKHTFLPHPHIGADNESIEETDRYRILYHGMEVATLSYCEDYRWANLYAKAPEMLSVLHRVRNILVDLIGDSLTVQENMILAIVSDTLRNLPDQDA